MLLDRGDPPGRAMAVRIAQVARTPELLTALSDFAVSQRGPDLLRIDAARTAMQAGRFAPGFVHMWSHGKWTDVILFDFEIRDEATYRHSPQVERWQTESIRLERAGDIDRAEELIRRALAVEPDAPDLLNNLASIYELRGQKSEAFALVHQLLERHPDYGFPRISLARESIERGDLDQARTLLEPLLTRKRFTAGEFAFYCDTQIRYLLARNDKEQARMWLDLWARIDPDDPRIAQWQWPLSDLNLAQRLFGRK